METLTYFVQINLFWLLLYACYWFALRRHTFFAWNRMYLLGSLLVAFALPLMPYPENMPGLTAPAWFSLENTVPLSGLETVNLPKTVFAAESYAATPADYPPEKGAASWLDFADWLAIIYCLGVCFMAIRLLRHLLGVYAFFQKGPCLDMDAYRLYLLDDDKETGASTPGSFSFLHHIVITRRDYELNFDTVLSHELAHVRQRHSWDVLLVEVLRVLFWFNPFLVFYKKSLQQVHEYLADREVCAWNATPEDASTEVAAPTPRDRYAAFMVSYAQNRPNADCHTARLVNPFFNSSLLKDRIVMLYKNKNSRWSLGKYAAVALLVGFVSLLAASCSQETNDSSEEIATVADKTISIEGTITNAEGTPLPGASIIVKGTQTGTTTTSQGEFLITAPAGSELDFSFIGHKNASLKMAGQGTVQVSLAEENASENSIAQKVSSDIGIVKIAQRGEKKITPDYAGDSIFTVVDTQPKFPGGIEAMYKFINDNMKYPAAARRAKVGGKVFLTFVVNADGSIQNIQVLKGMGFGTDEEAVRIMKQTPKWKPGAKENGEKVRVKYNLPISFVLPQEKKEIGLAKPPKVGAADDAPKVAVVERRRDVNTEVDSLIGLKFHLPQGGTDFDKNFKISIRGRDSFGSDEPLYVLDGVVSPIENPKFLANISPNDIEKIEVLKGDKAKSLYGVRGANGVVRVTTRQGAKMLLDIKK